MRWLLLILFLIPSPALAAIAFDAAEYSGSCTGTTCTLPTNHTATINNTIVCTGFINGHSTDNITGVTYGGTAMARYSIGTFVSGVGIPYLYCLLNPPSGSQSIVITQTAGIESSFACTASYTGVAQSGQPDATATPNTCTACTALTTSLTTIADNSWAFAFEGNSIGAPTAGAGTTARATNANGFGCFDGGALVHPAGSTSLITNIGSSGNQSVVMASFAPFSAVVAAQPTIFRLILWGNW